MLLETHDLETIIKESTKTLPAGCTMGWHVPVNDYVQYGVRYIVTDRKTPSTLAPWSRCRDCRAILDKNSKAI